MPDGAASVGELRYRIIIENYQQIRQQLAELGGVGGGGASAAASASGVGGNAFINNAVSRISSGGSSMGSTKTAGQDRSESGGGFLDKFRARFNGGGAYASFGFAGAAGVALAGLAVATAFDNNQTNMSSALSRASVAMTRQAGGNAALDYANAVGKFNTPFVGPILGLVGNQFGIGPRQIERARTDFNAAITASDARADSYRNLRYERDSYAAGSARNPENAAVRDTIRAQQAYDAVRVPEEREIGFLRRRLSAGGGNDVERQATRDQLAARLDIVEAARTRRDDDIREIGQRQWVYGREQSNQTRLNYGVAESMQTAAGGQRYSAAQALLKAQQDAELRQFDTDNSTAMRGPDGNMVSRLNPGARQQRDSLVTRQAAERELQAAERSHTLDVANLNLTTNERIQQSLKRRDPFGARAAAITGGAESEVQAYMYAEMPDQARRAAKLGVGDLELTRRNYLEGFRGVQYDVRNNPVDNPRDQENPAQVLQTIAQYIKELQSIVKALGSDS